MLVISSRCIFVTDTMYTDVLIAQRKYLFVSTSIKSLWMVMCVCVCVCVCVSVIRSICMSWSYKVYALLYLIAIEVIL